MVLGWIFHLDANAYLLIGVPLDTTWFCSPLVIVIESFGKKMFAFKCECLSNLVRRVLM